MWVCFGVRWIEVIQIFESFSFFRFAYICKCVIDPCFHVSRAWVKNIFNLSNDLCVIVLLLSLMRDRSIQGETSPLFWFWTFRSLTDVFSWKVDIVCSCLTRPVLLVRASSTKACGKYVRPLWRCVVRIAQAPHRRLRVYRERNRNPSLLLSLRCDFFLFLFTLSPCTCVWK